MSSVTIIYIVTALVGLAVAFLLAHLSKSSSQTMVKEEKKSQKYLYSGLPKEDYKSDSFKQTIFEEIEGLLDSKEGRHQITEKINDVFKKELEKKVNLTTQDLRRKYETVINQKSQNEEVAWKKYNKVLGEKKNTEAILRSVAEGLVVVDANGKVIMMNPAAEKLLGVGKKDKIGKSLTENIKEEQLVSLVKGTEEKGDKEIELISQEAETKKILRASSAVIENENGQTIGMVSVLSDITRQRELENLKSNFVANVTHELRTPIISVEKYLSLILNKSTGEINETQEQFLGIADRNLKRLNRLVNDLLDLAKLEAGKLELKKQLCAIDKIIIETIENLQTWASTKSIAIERRIQEGFPETNIDPDRIIQVLTNLIGNAVKFTPTNGKITVEAVLNKENNEIVISVQDTGIGIPKEQLSKVFDKFYQVGERMATDISGTGIGLSIAKEIVELHGGKIWAESEEHKGARFIFILPINK